MSLRSRTLPFALSLAFGIAALPLPALANDSSVSLQGGHIQLQQESDVELVGERLIFHHVPGGATVPRDTRTCTEEDWGPGPDCPAGSYCTEDGLCVLPEHWRAELVYRLRNTSDTPLTLDIGLPFYLPYEDDEHTGPHRGEEMHSFSTAFDGAEVGARRVDQEVEQPLGDVVVMYNRTYVSTVTLQPGVVHALSHRYTDYAGGGAGGGEWFSYILRTAASWNGAIGTVDIDFQLQPGVGPCVHVSLPHERVGDWIRVHLTDWNATEDFGILWARSGFLENAYMSFAERCDLLAALPDEERARAASRLELYYGAPHATADAAVLAEGPLPMCQEVDGFMGMSEAGEDLSALVFRQDPDYPWNVPEPVTDCLERLRADGPTSQPTSQPTP